MHQSKVIRRVNAGIDINYNTSISILINKFNRVEKDTVHVYRILEYFYRNILRSLLPTHDNDNIDINNTEGNSNSNNDIDNYNIKTLTVEGLLKKNRNNNRKLLNNNNNQKNIMKYPIHGIGFSNGGIFITKIALFTSARPKRRRNNENYDGKNRIKFSSMILISAGLWNDNEKHRYPSTLFIDMARNIELTNHNNVTIEKLKKRDILCKQFVSFPRPIYDTYFYDIGTSLISSLSLAPSYYVNKVESKFLHDNFLSDDLIWPGSFVFLDDPQIPEVNAKWRGIIQSMQIFYNKFDMNTVNAITEMINMAWGFKELTNEYDNDIITWLDNNSNNNI